MRKLVVALGLLFAFLPYCHAQPAAAKLVNPLLPSGADPWIVYRDGYYYYMNSTQTNLTLWKSRSVADLRSAEKKVVWLPPASGPFSHEIWAPELHFLAGKWYIYFAADAGANESHRIWVIENSSPDPMQGAWTMKGQVTDPTNRWAIDPTILEDDGKMYLLWSGWEGETNGTQSIYMAQLLNPWTVKGPRVRLSTPEYPWEEVGELTRPGQVEAVPHVNVNEGPEILKHGDKIFMVYSASGCWTDYYELGMMQAASGANLMDPSSWRKSDKPVFWQSPENSVYGPGHNSFFQSPDGKEDWILYHANQAPGEGCGRYRSPRAQQFRWKSDGTPDFGRPLSVDEGVGRPSGEVR